MRFIKVDRLNETCYFNPQKITKLFISDDIITIFFENETLVFVAAIPFEVNAFIGILFKVLSSYVAQSIHELSL